MIIFVSTVLVQQSVLLSIFKLRTLFWPYSTKWQTKMEQSKFESI